ncbi:MAG: DUF1295 domain-containing protein [Planctomycetota bacterium]
MLNTLLPLAIALAAVCTAMYLLWRVQKRTGNAGIVDVAWTFSVGALAVLFAAWPTDAAPAWLRVLVGVQYSVWSLRLGTYLYRRVVGHAEEGRYATLREKWGDDADRKMLRFYQFQAVGAWVFALPALVVSRSPEPPAAAWVAASLLLWLLGIVGVALSDRQLEQFKADPNTSGKTCRRGLWRYSRHPNYFFEWLHWTSYVALSAASGYWWVSALVAFGLLYLVLFVTGIPPTEAQAVARRGDDYRHYQKTTSAFVPWPPKASTESPA